MNSHGYVTRFAELALKCIAKEYPNKLDHALSDASQLRSPRELHPAFYGCYDWHSSVHSHWLLVHLLRARADGQGQDGAPANAALPEADIREALDANLTAENIRAEDEYFRDPGRASYERPYGWAWLLKLHEELYLWDDPDAGRWFDSVRPLAETIVSKYLAFFPKQKYPIRVGTHFNTAFGLAFAWDYAETLARGGKKSMDARTLESIERLKLLVCERARTYFADDRDSPASWEPGGDDFLSPSLIEADLMRRVFKGAEFVRWFDDFLPAIEDGSPAKLLVPADVTDRSDPKIVHLDGVNLSRAWCMRSIASALPDDSPRRLILERAAAVHAQATLPHITSGDYAGEHWLATFAVYMLSIRPPLAALQGGSAGANAELG
ncbi:MAG: DUF2891 domain-containing protein [Acidobacteria bacterium]|nr:DUF2891 domain-containing protein [Acidobacteriota bacterium]